MAKTQKIDTALNQSQKFDSKILMQTASLLKNEFPIAIEEYLEDAADYIREIQNGLEKNNPEQITRGAHPLKSNSRSFGLIALAEYAEEINNLARTAHINQNATNAILSLFPRLQQAFYSAEKYLRSALKDLEF